MSLGLTGIELSREQWDHYCQQRVQDRVFAKRQDPGRAMREAHESMVRDYGPRPEEPQKDDAAPSAPWWLRAGVGLIAGGQMDKAKAFLSRYGVLVSVIYLALLGILDVLRVQGVEWAGWGVTALGTLGGLFSINPDPAVVAVVPLAVTSGAALYGAIVKIIKIVKAPKA